MRMFRASLVVVLAACGGHEPLERVQDLPDAAVELGPRARREWALADELGPFPERTTCPVASAAAADAPVVVAHDVLLVHSKMPLRWVARDQHVHELASDPRHPTDLGLVDYFKGWVWDDRYWYRRYCYTENMCVIDRIDRVTGESTELAGSDGMTGLQLSGKHVYWLDSPCFIPARLHRVPKEGGEQQWIDMDLTELEQASWDDEHVGAFRAYPNGILARVGRRLAWRPANGQPARIVARGVKGIGPAVLDADTVYFITPGKADGAVYRVPLDRKGGPEVLPVKLVGPIEAPSAIATFGPNVYFMSRKSGSVFAVPKQGGTVRRVVTDERQPCADSDELWADERGLFWTRTHGGVTSPSTIYFQPWSAIDRAN